MRAPFYKLEIGGKEYKLVLTTASTVQVEERLGFPLLEALSDKGLYAKTFAVILWGALQKFHAGMTMDKVYSLVDELESDDKAIGDKLSIIMEIAKVSGFFTTAELEKMAEAEEEAKKEEAEA